MERLDARKISPWLDHLGILLLLLALLAERLIVLGQLGAEYQLGANDDLGYVVSGITFIKTGRITMYGGLSAQIMPGMPVLIGLFSLAFGEGHALWLALKLCWMLMGTATAWVIYRAVRLYAPWWCGVLAAAPLLAPNYVWMDCLILTETPYLLGSMSLLYFTLRLKKTGERRAFIGLLCAFLLTLTIRANVLSYMAVALLYLLIGKYDKKRLLRQTGMLLCAMLVLIVPWTVRNAILFHDFVPFNYGGGNPLLLGTYQGYGWPEDGELDYETNVDAVMAEEYADYYDENGEPREPYLVRYLSLERDGVMARYRIREWLRRDPKSFLRSYLITKPRMMVDAIFYWKELMGVPWHVLHRLRLLTLALGAGSVVLSLVLRRRRGELLFLVGVYGTALYIYALAFSFDRYAQPLVPIWYVMIGLGLGLLAELGKKIRRKVKREVVRN